MLSAQFVSPDAPTDAGTDQTSDDSASVAEHGTFRTLDGAATGSFIVDLGDENSVFGVTRLDDGTALLAGDALNTSTGLLEGKLFTVAPDGSSFSSEVLGNQFGGEIRVTGISPNGQFVSGFHLGTHATGLIWDTGDLSTAIDVGEIIPPEFSPPASTITFDVSSNGTAVGTTNGGLIAFVSDPATGIAPLPGTDNGAGARAIDDVIVGISVDSAFGTFFPTLWDSSGRTFLDVGTGFNGRANDVSVSSDGSFIGGFVTIFIPATTSQAPTAEFQATVWENGTINQLTDASGDPFFGEVLAVSDNGFAVGESPQGGFIWHESFAGVELFEDWLPDDLSISSPITSLTDVYFDGTNLNFAANDGTNLFNGSAFLISVQFGRSIKREPSHRQRRLSEPLGRRDGDHARGRRDQRARQ